MWPPPAPLVAGCSTAAHLAKRSVVNSSKSCQAKPGRPNFFPLFIKVNFKCVSVSQTDLVHFNFLRCCFFSFLSAQPDHTAPLLFCPSGFELKVHSLDFTQRVAICGEQGSAKANTHTHIHTPHTGRTAAFTTPPAGELKAQAASHLYFLTRRFSDGRTC